MIKALFLPGCSQFAVYEHRKESQREGKKPILPYPTPHKSSLKHKNLAPHVSTTFIHTSTTPTYTLSDRPPYSIEDLRSQNKRT